MANKYLSIGGERILLVENAATGDLSLAVSALGAGGVAPQMDDTDKMAVSLYGTSVSPGDVGINAYLPNLDSRTDVSMYGLAGISLAHQFSNSEWQRVRNNHEITVLASAARTASVASNDLVNYNARGVRLTIDITAYTAGSLTIIVQIKDTLSGKYFPVLSSGAIAGIAEFFITLYPGVTPVANIAVSAPLSRIWRVSCAHGDATSITYSIGANYIN